MQRTRHDLSLLLGLVLLTSPLHALAEPPPPPAGSDATASEPPVSDLRLGLSMGAAFVPGLLVHGSGHLALGDSDTGWTLLAAQGIGLVSMVGGIVGLAVSGAAPEVTGPLIVTLIEGFGLFAFSGLSDIYGVLAPAEGFGTPRLRTSVASVELGYAFVDNPVFEYGHFARVGAELAWASVVTRPRAWIALDDDNWRLEIPVIWRLLGPRPNRLAADGSMVELEVGYVGHRHGTEGFTEQIGHLLARGRLDLWHVSESLRGAFAETALGAGLGIVEYDAVATEGTELLLGELAWGIYLGDGLGELALTYDHRHDGYAAGFKAPGLGSGTMGHFGLRTRLALWEGLGLAVDLQAGSAVVGALSVIYQMPPLDLEPR